MNFTITTNTGNIEQDVWNTINNFNEEEQTKFIQAIKLKKEDSNITGTSIFFRYPECQQLLSSIEDATKVPLQTRKMIRDKTYRLDTENILTNLSNQEKTKNELINKIISNFKTKININEKIIEVLANDKYDKNFYNLCFAIISSNDYFNKFINYNDNLEIFKNQYTQKEYVYQLSQLLGFQEKEIYQENPIYKYQIITQDMIIRYKQLRKIINVDIEMLGAEVFNQEGYTSYSKEKQQATDNDWVVNPELIEYVLQDMEPNYNIFEQISHIYIKLCQALRYNLGYHIKKWTTNYNKEHQETITPKNNEIICSEFSIIATNIINKLNNDIEARCIIRGQEQHLLFGIYHKEKNIRINFDSTKLVNEFDDLGRVKIGLPLVGITYICDRNDEFGRAFDNVYRKLCQLNRIETMDLIEAYEQIRKQPQLTIDTYENICVFFEKMKDKNVVGSELLSAFKRLYRQGFFGKIKYSIVGEDKKLTFTERQKLETQSEILDGLEENIIIQNEEDYYLIKLNDCKFIPMSKDELNMLFEEDKMVYFNPKYRLDGIGVKQCTRR